MGITSDHLSAVVSDVQASLAARDAHAMPPVPYLRRMVDAAISTIGADPTEVSGWFAEMVEDPATGRAWVDGSRDWLTATPIDRLVRAYWERAGEDNREFFPERDTPEYVAADWPLYPEFCTTTACAQLELACEVFDLIKWTMADDDGSDA
jgi:hypothetical protein